MSRIGKLPVPVPENVTVELDGLTVSVKGPKGELTRTMPEGVTLGRDDDGAVTVTRVDDSRAARSRHGLVRTLIHNMVTGVTDGYSKSLELVGVGYRAAAKGSDVELQVGFSHPVLIEAPEGIAFQVEQTKITVSGIDKVLVGQVAANIRKVRPPEPYKGKGIKYEGEIIRRKAGKAAGR
ncbi:MAG: 50S ribosomal protein L6 [Nitriliruptoraceae bacterium]|nr:50S ribosomal protein L6 [Nitriliruptoraceae bacterium]